MRSSGSAARADPPTALGDLPTDDVAKCIEFAERPEIGVLCGK
jgi:hypothetical protein